MPALTDEALKVIGVFVQLLFVDGAARLTVGVINGFTIKLNIAILSQPAALVKCNVSLPAAFMVCPK